MDDNKRQPYSIYPARSPQDIAAAKRLFTSYKESLGIDLTFQNYDSEFTSLPGRYAPPMGELLLARRDDDSNGTPIACVGLRLLQLESCCEMKRLFVMPAGRGSGVGKALVERVIDVARGIGYREMRLDTLASMTRAIDLYMKFGFVEMEAYYHNPIEGSKYMVLRL